MRHSWISSGFVALMIAVIGCGNRPGGRGDDEAACETSCTIGESECVVDQTRTCLDRGESCGVWGPTEPCPRDQPFCSSGACGSECSDECTLGARRCEGDAVQTCGDHDADACTDWGPTIACGIDEVCGADARCIESCDGAACPCAAGDTKACTDVGACSSGVRSCVAGSFGACQWHVGPQPEVCDGLDNDCNGIDDDDALLTAPACAVQTGVCAGAVRRCGGSAGWLGCSSSVYADHAAGAGVAYQSTETLCDGQDNDCDNAIDEPAQCCTPDCSAATCGGSDGCGGVCDAGACGANQTCEPGGCACAYLTCSGVCCGAGELCQGSTCVAAPAPVWRQLTPITTEALTGIWGSSASNIWAVGKGGTMLHFNGTQWRSVLSGTAVDLEDVWGTGPNDVWAVGGEWEGVILHYNGSQWSQVAAPERIARAIWGTSPTNVFVAGGTTTDGYIQRYNGSTWTQVASQSNSRFMDISGVSSSDVWAIDLFSARHYTGSTWSTTTLSTQLLSSVWIGGPNDGWAVGDGFAVHRFNGTTWQQVASPLAYGSNRAVAVWGRTTNDVWAVGWAVGHRSIIHFDGAGWQLTGPVLNVTFQDVWASSSSDVWVVGTQGTILHYSP
jgi:hypothetical protein